MLRVTKMTAQQARGQELEEGQTQLPEPTQTRLRPTTREPDGDEKRQHRGVLIPLS